MASESVLQYLGRCRPSDFDPVAMLVMLPPSEYAEAKAKTLRTGTHTTDFDDEDGVCTYFMRDGHLHLRTARGTVKVVTSTDVMRSLGAIGTAVSPLGRFMEACHAAGVSQEQLMDFAKKLKDDSLLDSIVVFKQAGQRYGEFVYVTKFPTDEAPDMQAMFPKQLMKCAANHSLYVALVRREGLHIGQLVAELRRTPAVDTLRNLSTRADAIITAVRLDDSGGAA